MSLVGNYNALNNDGARGRGPMWGQTSRFENDLIEEIDAVPPPTDQQRDADVVSLARQLSRQSSTHGRQGSISSHFEGIQRQLTRRTTTTEDAHEAPHVGGGLMSGECEEGSDLDPFSENFNVNKWIKMLVKEYYAALPPRMTGIAFQNLGVHGFGSDADYQKTFGNIPFWIMGQIRDKLMGRQRKVQILHDLDGYLEAGEMLVVLGPPGSGCSTLLKTIAGEMNGIYLNEGSDINYRGIAAKKMYKQFRGEALYTAEVDVHFPKLTVGETLTFAARARCPREVPGGLSPLEFSKRLRDVVMTIFGIAHTMHTKVGNDFIRGVSGGERKRVTIAEAALSGAPLQCWDNSTRGLDAANAIEFVKNLRLGAEYFDATSVVAIYQAPQAAYDLFDKVSLLYKGQQIYFGKCSEAKDYFIRQGWFCPTQQTVPDFLTSLTSSTERRAREGFEHKVPQTPDDFARLWKASPEYAKLQAEIVAYNEKYPIGGEQYEQFLASRRAQQSKHLRPKSPYTLSYMGQIKLCLRRGFERLKADPSLTISQLFGNMVMGLIVSSIFFNLQPTTESFYSRGGLVFFAILLNAFGSALEILTLYAQRPIVEKQARYAFYHPSAEAFASMLTDLPYKIVNSICFNLILYFMTNLRRTPGNFFFFFFVSFLATLTMSMLFRSIASLSRSLTQALAPAALIILALVIFTGFALPVPYMLGWSRWINYLNPIAFAFESLMINEFHGRDYECSQFIPAGPGYEQVTGTQRVCSSVGSLPGASSVSGTTYIEQAYEYLPSHKWRNVGIMFVFMFGLAVIYLTAAEFISAKKSKGEVLIYPRGKIPSYLKSKAPQDDPEAQEEKMATKDLHEQGTDRADAIIQRQTAIFSWKDVVYDIKIKGEPRRILDHVDGWVKPGTLTALMGVSGAGKTTLLDVLATRVTMGVVTGEMLVDGRPRDKSFQRKTGYVQQQDLHLETSTVREALRFSAVLRQPAHISRKEKYEYVEEVLKLLEMEEYADAVVGVPGEGLNVEQRKRLTIGVELVAKPELLLFLDEPTSGLDSQTSWNILMLLRKLTANGQAILCTIHQPSAMLFEQFDRLLFLAKGGKTVYFGEVGHESKILVDYMVRNGATPPHIGVNPAEWMLEVIGAAPGSHTTINWPEVWKNSPERILVRQEYDNMNAERRNMVAPQTTNKKANKAAYAEFAAPLSVQLMEVLRRCSQQYWRTPSYLWAKFALCISSALFIGFSFFQAKNSLQGLQNQLFSIFMAFTIFGQLVQQIMPAFVTNRALYEVRERPSKTYSWVIFIISNILVEIPWTILAGTVFFFCWYYPIGYYRNALWTDTVHLRGALMWLLFQSFMLFTSTFSIMVVAGIELAETAGNIANLLFSLCLVFCGVLVSRDNLPGFWVFMNRVSPFTYFTEGMLGVGVGRSKIECSDVELLRMDPPSGQTCGQYLQNYLSFAGGYVTNSDATSGCQLCPIDSTDAFLATFDIKYSRKWMDYYLIWFYILFNVVGAIFIYWLARVPKNKRKKHQKAAADDTIARTTTTATTATTPAEAEKAQYQAPMAESSATIAPVETEKVHYHAPMGESSATITPLPEEDTTATLKH